MKDNGATRLLTEIKEAWKAQNKKGIKDKIMLEELEMLPSKLSRLKSNLFKNVAIGSDKLEMLCKYFKI